jgi:hypothetical protein
MTALGAMLLFAGDCPRPYHQTEHRPTSKPYSAVLKIEARTESQYNLAAWPCNLGEKTRVAGRE